MMAASRRSANMRSSIYQASVGYWHGRVTMGVRDDGRPDRRHVRGKDKATVAAKVRKLERQREDGIIIKPGRAWTTTQWLTYWLEEIARPSIRYKPYIGYRTAVYRHLLPGIGAHKIDRLQWARLHDPTRTLEIMRALQRRTWQHGCADPHACGGQHHKIDPCPEDCTRHPRRCPPPCPPGCIGHARWCPQRRDGGLDHPGKSGGPQTWKDEGLCQHRGNIPLSCGNVP